KRLALPRCIRGESRFEAHWITDPRRDLVPGILPGLMEPRENARACRGAKPFDLIIVPGIAFDRRGYRIGFGAGMYDRFLVSHLDSRRLALAYSLQIVDHVPADPHDLPVHAILTEEGMIEPDGE
ncbi:MAG TPA: 5-formyltetrahydrofolate cyclo-ligase, partial [Sumerlaeia bacterium]|nr:5-formyltetrahydrofolate cyclo-ligase [Sumerlaeia bacterium]